ncbi:YitT family protein [Pectinatus frisingensis]|uniref:YitT family protein n=1 Tax=Pectinatus frisingensis TaxID=865 RepID=UPI0015F6F624|nr:YitT family protein [Pectinatus frisingensis]
MNKQHAHNGHQYFDYILKYLFLFIGSIITAIGLELFLVPNNIIDGGVVGLSIMGSYLTGLPLGAFLTVLNIPFLYLGYRHIGKSFVISSVFAIICLSGWTSVFVPIAEVTDTPFLATVFGGIITGLGVGLIIRNGGSLDGTEMVAIILDKKSVFSVGEIVMFINLFILSGAGLIFGWDNAMYSLVAYFIIARTIDVVIQGLEESYAVMIVTSCYDLVADKLVNELGRGVTLLHGEGGYSGETKKILYCVVTRLEIDKLKTTVLDVDDMAFVTIYKVNDIIGGRFKK